MPPNTAKSFPDAAEAPLYYSSTGLSAFFHDALAELDRSLRGDVDYYVNEIPPASDVLELGCGSGRVALALASAGHQVTGIDLSPTMLDLARQKMEALPAAVASRVRLREADMTELNLAQKFDAVIVPFYSFNHLADPDQRLRALHVIGHHLRANGRAFIHAARPDLLNAPLPSDHRPIRGRFNSNRLLRWRALSRSVDPAKKRTITLIEHAVFTEDDKLLASSTESLTLYWFDDSEVEQAALRAGMEVAQSEVRFASFDPETPRKMYVLRHGRGNQS